MCYAYPGPRCGSDVSKELTALKGKKKDLYRQFCRTRNEYRQVAKEVKEAEEAGATPDKELSKSHKNLHKKFNQERDKYNALTEKIDDKDREYYATKDGIESLKKTISSKELNQEDVSGDISLLKECEAEYNERVIKYDRKFETVNLVKPSTEYDQESIAGMEEEIRDFKQKILKTRDEFDSSEDQEQKAKLKKRMANYKTKIDRLMKRRSHALATAEHVENYIVPDPLGAERHRKNASIYARSKQHVSGYSIQEAKSFLKAELAENKGKGEFRALFDMDGNYVKAWPIQTRYGQSWMIPYDPDDPQSSAKEYVNLSKSKDPKKRDLYLARQGYMMGSIKAPAYVGVAGQDTASPRAVIKMNRTRTNADTIEILSLNINKV